MLLSIVVPLMSMMATRCPPHSWVRCYCQFDHCPWAVDVDHWFYFDHHFAVTCTYFYSLTVVVFETRVVKTVPFLYPVNRSRKRPVNRRTVTYLLTLRFYTSDSPSC